MLALFAALVFTADSPMGLVMHHAQSLPDRPSLRTELAVPAALDDLMKWRPGADRKALQVLITKATSERVDSGSREGASRELFRSIRALFDSIS